MGAILEHIKQESLTSFGFGGTTEFTDNIRANVTSKHIGQTIYTKNEPYRNKALMRNPQKYRYAGYDTVPSTGGARIGEAADAAIPPMPPRTGFLDDELGLYGYTMSNNLMFKNIKYNSLYPNGALLNDTDVYDSYVTSAFPLPSLWNRNSSLGLSSNSVIYSIDAPIDSTSIFGKGMEEVILWARNTKTVQKVNPYSEKDKFNDSVIHYIYQEAGNNNGYIINGIDNLYNSDNVNFIEEGSDIQETRSLLNITNRLFREGKIKSLVNRFSSGENGFATDGGVVNSSFSQYGHSRGRNLLKKDLDNKKENTPNGYFNPYCRVWTSHYQYSKFSDMIRPFADTNETLMVNLPGYRPNNGAKRLQEHGVMLDSGVPRIAPTSNADGTDITENIKRCMFSIENLAWKNSGLNDKLSAGQRGPHDGRIMWFPPYDLTFNEQSAAQWEQSDFIGRGEPIYTYKNSRRTGSLSFVLLVDHPSMIDAYGHSQGLLNANETVMQAAELDLLRFFAGCDNLSDKIGSKGENETIKVIEEVEQGIVPAPKADPIPEEYKFKTFLCFANSFSGVDYKENKLDAITAMRDCKYEISPMGKRSNDTLLKCAADNLCDENIRPSRDKMKRKYADDEAGLKEYVYDTQSFGLNTTEVCGAITKYISEGKSASAVTYNNVTFTKNYLDAVISHFDLESCDIIAFTEIIDSFNSRQDLINYLRKLNGVDENAYLLDSADDFIISVEYTGHASSHGYADQNSKLALYRASTLISCLKEKNILNDNDEIIQGTCSEIQVANESNLNDRSSFNAKIDRCASLTISLKSKNGMVKINESEGTQVVTKVSSVREEKVRSYQYGPREKDAKSLLTFSANTSSDDYMADAQDEYYYFKNLEKNDKLTYDSISHKIKYFNPAFHSITPEGFNARLNFLHQCTRQGPTSSTSDNFRAFGDKISYYGAGNLSFGRAPYCILRIGDFYNTKVCFDSVQIDYSSDGIKWDMNQEGIGVQPMYAKVTLQINFVGGSDLEGPIDKLQNAISSNYYANSSVYDKLADIASK